MYPTCSHVPSAVVTSPTTATPMECPTTATPMGCPTCSECTSPTIATHTGFSTPHVTRPATTHLVKIDATAVTVGVTNENETDLVLTTNPTGDATDPAITTTDTKPPTHTSTGGTTTTTDVTFIGTYTWILL